MANPTVRVGFLGDASQLAREARRAQDSLDGVSRHAHTTSTALGTALGTVAGRGIGAIAEGAKHAVGSVAELASASIEAASAMDESLHKNTRVFAASASVVQSWAADNTKNILLTKQAAIDAAGGFGNLFTSMGVGTPQAAKLSTSLVGLGEDLSSFAGISTDDAFTALRAGLAGQARSLKQYGVDLAATRVQEEARALGLVKTVKNTHAVTAAQVGVAAATAHLTDVQAKHGKGTLAAATAQTQLTAANDRLRKAQAGQTVALTAAQTVQARYALIVKGLATAQGNAKRNQDGYSESTKILHKNIGDLEASIGQKLLPTAQHATKYVSDLVLQFDNGTGAGGRLRTELGNLGEDARGIGQDLKPVVGVARWFADHPTAFKAAAEGMALYAAASKSAAIWNTRLAGANALGAVGSGLGVVAKEGTGAAGGVAAVGAASKSALPLVLKLSAAMTVIVEGIKAINAGIHPGRTQSEWEKAHPATAWEKAHGFGGSDLVFSGDPDKGKPPAIPKLGPDTTTRSDRQAEDDFLHGRNPIKAANDRRARAAAAAAATVKAASDAAAATKAAADKTAAAQQYATDQMQNIADAKQKAADALRAATDAVQQALDDRKQMAQGVHDSLVGSTSILRDGAAWTAKDLLSRFQVEAHKLQRFQTALGTLAAKGYDRSIIQQAASAGVGNLGAVVGLSHASAAQVRQIDATQRAIDRAASGAGNTAAASMGPIVNVYIDGKQIAAKVITSHSRDLAHAVNVENARMKNNGHRLAP